MLSGFHKKILIPFSAFVLFGTIALVLWQYQNKHDRELVLHYIETSVEQVRIRVEGLMNARLASLELMADRWVDRRPSDFSRHSFQGFASALYENYPGYASIFWIDAAGGIRWVFPEDVPIGPIEKELTLYRQLIKSAGSDNQKNSAPIVISPCAFSQQGDPNFQAFKVLKDKDELRGYLGGFFSVDKVMMLCLTREVLNDFYIRLSEENHVIYQAGYPDKIIEEKLIQEPANAPRAVREIRFGSKIWTIMLTLNQTGYPKHSSKNFYFLLFGLTLAAALSLVLYLLIQRMDMYKASRDQAIVEVNERKQAQAALRTNEKKLQALLAELTSKNAELESFVYMISHDLKTPIVTIEGFIGALREDFGDKIPDMGGQYLGYISNAAHKMELLINELLNYSRIGRLEGKKTAFSMDIPVQDAIATLKSQIDAFGITVSAQKDLPVVYADGKRIEQVVFNLLSNAVKYIGRDNPDPRIEIGYTAQNSENVFWIRDNGIGIDQKYFDKIFQIFERLPAAKQVSEGTGVGLAIVKRIIECHGGQIWLASELCKGTTFYFTVKGKEAQ